MISTLVRSIPMAVIMMILSGDYTWETFLVGMIAGFAILNMLENDTVDLNFARLPGQVIALVIYLARLFIDIVLSGVDVARRVLSPTVDINPGIIPVETGDPSNNAVIAALSAHSITITPGEMVIDFVEMENRTIMYVHALDVEDSKDSVSETQTRRLRLYDRILGRSASETTASKGEA